MTSLLSHPTPESPRSARPRGALVRLARAAATAAQRRPRTIIAVWLLVVAACLASGAVVGTRSLTDAQSEVGQSARADALLQRAGLRDPAIESILVTAPTSGVARAAADDLVARLSALREVAAVTGPAQSAQLLADNGRIALVQARLRGDPDSADERVGALLAVDARVQRAHPGAVVREAGDGTETRAVNDVIASDLSRAEWIALPITLVILVLAFGAVVAACVPLVLGVTAVAAAVGAIALVSHVAPNSSSTSAVVILIGLAVGVDYSLFYVRREREERRRGLGSESALIAAAASVGRAILISGLTVMVALAGLLITGAGDLVSIGLGTIVVVAMAVLGSLTVLPAMLALLGDRIDRGRVPGYRALVAAGERRRARAGRRTGAWAALARVVTSHPATALVSAVCVLGALAVPMLGMRTGNLQMSDLPGDLPITQAMSAIERSFPGAPADAVIVVRGQHLDSTASRASLAALGRRAAGVTGGKGGIEVAVSRTGSVARVNVPMPERGRVAAQTVIHRLRDSVAPEAARIRGVDSRALITGDAASSLDYSERMSTATPEVIGFVLILGFILLVLTFRAPFLAAAVMGLNLLSVAAAYGILVAVFQGDWAERLLGFQSGGSIINWLPIFMFVVLFGLSMDYTILVLERMREARQGGLSPREAAAEGVAATAGTITTAAVVMMAVFSIFATLGVITFKQLGIGLAAAVLLDATLVRGVALPAAVALIGGRGWPVAGLRCEDPHVADGRTREPT